MHLNQRMDKGNVVHLQNRELLSSKKQQHLEIGMQMDGARKKIQNKVTLIQKDKCSMYLLINGY